MDRINQVINLLDSAIFLYGQESNMTLGMLDKTGFALIEISERIDNYDNLLINK